MPQVIDRTKRGYARQEDILAAFRDRLRVACEECDEMTCFISDQPIPVSIPAGGGHCLTVSIGNGSFDQSLFAGGGHAALNEDSEIIVTIMIRISLDRVPQAERALISLDRGIISRWKRDVLKALLLSDPNLGAASQPWEPLIGDKPLCREQIRPVTATSPADVPGHQGWVGMQIAFAVSFDWELYT